MSNTYQIKWSVIKAVSLGVILYFALRYILSLFGIGYGSAVLALVCSSITVAYLSPCWKILAGTSIAVFASIYNNILIILAPNNSDFPAWSQEILMICCVIYGVPALIAAAFSSYVFHKIDEVKD